MSSVADITGQIVMIGFRGVTVDSQIVEMIEKHRVGCIVLNQQNIVDVQQVKDLTRSLQQVAQRAGHAQPLLIATDQEGGMLATIRDERGITQFPGAMALSSAVDAEALIFAVARATALELLAIGINWVLGPVLDILSNPANHLLGVRTFGRTSLEVSKYATACARGFRASGIVTCGKHFPGYGNAFVSSSAGVPVISESKDQIQDNLVPYRACLSEGTLDSVLIGGAVIPKISGQLSACLSAKIIKTFLRTDLQYNGLVVSDCLQMESIHNDIGIPQAAVMAIWAGCDLLLNCHNRMWQVQVIDALNEAVSTGALPVKLVSQAAERVLQLKRNRITWKQALGESIELPDMILHDRLSQQAYDQCVHIVRDNGHILPLSHQSTILLITPLIRDFHSQDKGDEHHVSQDVLMMGEACLQDLGKKLSQYTKVIHTSYTAHGMSSEQEALLARSSAVIVVTADGVRNLYQISFTKHLSMVCKTSGKAFCVLAISNPFDFWHEEGTAPTYVITHEMTKQALDRAVQVLMMSPSTVQHNLPDASRTRKLSRRSFGVKRSLPDRAQWLTSVWRLGDRLPDRLLKSVNILEPLAADLRQIAEDSINEITCVKNSNTGEIYGVAIVETDILKVLAVSESHQRMSIGFSLLKKVMENAAEKGHTALAIPRTVSGKALLAALNISVHKRGMQDMIKLDEIELRTATSPT